MESLRQIWSKITREQGTKRSRVTERHKGSADSRGLGNPERSGNAGGHCDQLPAADRQVV